MPTVSWGVSVAIAKQVSIHSLPINSHSLHSCCVVSTEHTANNGQQLLSTSYVPGALPSVLHISCHVFSPYNNPRVSTIITSTYR